LSHLRQHSRSISYILLMGRFPPIYLPVYKIKTASWRSHLNAVASSLPSLRSTSRGTFEEPRGGSESARFAEGLCKRALMLSMQARLRCRIRRSARASSETHVALCIRLPIPSEHQRDDKNRLIEFSMSLPCIAAFVRCG